MGVKGREERKTRNGHLEQSLKREKERKKRVISES
jgi:hypothetical protein